MMYYLLDYFRTDKYRVPTQAQDLAKLYEEFAQKLSAEIPSTGEGAEAIRKLLESRDAAIRAKMS